MDKIITITRKEWAEMFKNKMVFFTVLFLPLLLAIMPLGMLVAFNSVEGMSAEMNDPSIMTLAGEMCTGLSETDCALVYTLNLFVLMFMVLPVAIPVTIAAYSIVGEKTTRSLEPLLATPITTIELLSAKIIAAVVPAIVATWVAFGVFLVGAKFMTPPAVFAEFFSAHWLLAIFLVSPLMTILSTCLAVIVSSRVSDPRVAEQLSAVVVLPVVLLIIGQSVGLILINRQFMLWLGLGVLVLDAVLLYLAIRLFQRETILTRWK
ncbi:MAG: ABC transporter permease subunit [Anaerolineae bacterium]|nr:ABC transporter permease subunit [Promineifilum sp.]MCZ2113151.1 ABC transporter permease subunit [Anaerolineae bacterium]HNS40203.1 ABC transporter permease subunit [Promineifilum sp.]